MSTRESAFYAVVIAGVLGATMQADARSVLLAASTDANRILQFDGETGEYLGDFVTQGSGGLDYGFYLTQGPDGNIYAGSHHSHCIMRYNLYTGDPFPGPLGTPGTAEFVPPGSSGLTYPAGMAFGPDGNLYVSVETQNYIARYDGATGAPVGSGFGLRKSDVPLGLAFGPDGQLHVCNRGSAEIQRYDAETGEFLGIFAGPETGLTSPGALVFHETATGPVLLVSDGSSFGQGAGHVHSYECPSGTPLGMFVPAGSGGLGSTSGLAIGPDANLYVSSPSESRIFRYDGETGEFIDMFADFLGLPGPVGLLFVDIPELPDRNRVLATAPPRILGQTAIRVTLTTMYDETVCPPRGGALPDLSAFEGQVRWLGPPERFPEGTIPPLQDFLAAPLQCCPHFRAWNRSGLAADFAGAVVSMLHVYGAEIVPCSTFEMDVVDEGCPDLSDENCYTEMGAVHTGLHGDVSEIFGLVNFIDIGSVVQCFKNIPLASGWNKTRCMMRSNVVPLDQTVNFVDIGLTVQAFKTIPYGEAGPSACGPCD